jgi:uncharacterized Tic20 family protein
MENSESRETGEAGLEKDFNEPPGRPRSERQWAMGCHLLGLCGFLSLPFIASIVGTMVLWLIKREDSAFIDDQGRESVNFQITVFIYAMIAIMLIPLAGLGMILLPAVVIFDFVCILVAAVKASEGVRFRYPACIRFIK